jgi:hypothetical protein
MPLINEAGRHAVTVSEMQFGESQTGTPFVQLTFEREDKAVITGWLYLSEKAFERTVKVLREVFEFDDNFDTLEGQVVGKRAAIVTEFEKGDDGKDRLRVKWINPEGAGAPQAKPIANQSTFLKTLSQKAARIAKDAPAAASAARPAQAPRPAAAARPAPAAKPTADEPLPF